jgi:ArsR family transcriptional regulator
MCGDIVNELPQAESSVTQHLKIIKESDLIRGAIHAPRVCCCFEPRELARLRQTGGHIVQGKPRRDWP